MELSPAAMEVEAGAPPEVVKMDALPAEVVSIVLSHVGHVRWLHATLCVSKLFKTLSLALLKQRTARLAGGKLDEHKLLGRVRVRSYTIVDPNYQSAFPKNVWRDSNGSLVSLVVIVQAPTRQTPGRRSMNVIKLENVETVPIKRTDSGDMTSLHGTWRVEEPFRRATPEFEASFTRGAMQVDAISDARFWECAETNRRAFFLPKTECLYLHRMRADGRIARMNLKTGELSLQEEQRGMMDPQCIVVAPNGCHVASASTYCKTEEVPGTSRFVQRCIGYVTRHEAGLQGALHYLDTLSVPGRPTDLHYVSDTTLLCSWGRFCHDFDPFHSDKGTGVQLLDFASMERKTVSASKAFHSTFAHFPDKRMIVYTAGRVPYEHQPHIVVYKNSAASLRKTSNFLFSLFEHDFEVEAAFGKHWWPHPAGDTGAASVLEAPGCEHIRPVNNDMVLFAVEKYGLELVDVTKETRVMRVTGPGERLFRRMRSLEVAEDGRLVIYSGDLLALLDMGIM